MTATREATASGQSRAPLAGKADLLIVSLVSLVAAGALAWAPQVLGDPDTYWHVAAGEWILRHGQIPQVDPFSYTFAGRPWTAHEWLSEVLMAMAFRLGGWAGVMALTGIAFGATLAIFGNVLRKTLPTPALIGTLVFVALGAGPSLLGRPHLLAAPVFVAWFAGLLAARSANRAPNLWLLPLMILWANLHGSFVLGLAVTGAFAAEALLLNPGQRTRQFRDWALFGLAATAAALVTPHGVSGLLFPFKVMGMATLPVIAEWRSADFTHLTLFEIVLLEGLFFVLWLGVRMPIVRLLLLLGFFHLALAHQRHQLLFVFSAGMLLAEPIAAALRDRARRDAARAPSAGAPRTWAPLLALALIAVTGLRLVAPVERRDDITPTEALAAVDPSLRRKPVFNEYDFGGFLIFNGVRPYIDGRADLYGDAFVASYSAMVASSGGAALRELDRRGVSWTILRPSSPMVAVLDSSPRWTRRWADATAVVHTRALNGSTPDVGPVSPP